MAWSEVVDPRTPNKKTKKMTQVERFGCAQKQELREIFGTIFDRQANSSKKKDLHIRMIFETNQMEDSSSSVGSLSRTTIDIPIGGTAGATPMGRSPVDAMTPK